MLAGQHALCGRPPREGRLAGRAGSHGPEAPAGRSPLPGTGRTPSASGVQRRVVGDEPDL